MAAPNPLSLADSLLDIEVGTPICRLSALKKAGAIEKTIKENDAEFRLFLIWHDNAALAFENRCPHAGTPLNLFGPDFFDISGRYLLCRTHGALFEPKDGRCRRGPCKGQYLRRIAICCDHETDQILAA